MLANHRMVAALGIFLDVPLLFPMPNIAHPYNVMALKNILLNRRLSRYLLTGIISLLITLASEARAESLIQPEPPDFVAPQLSTMKDCVAARGVKLPDFGDKNPHLTATQTEVVKTCAQESGFTGSASPMPPKLLPQLPPPQQPLQLPPILTLQ